MKLPERGVNGLGCFDCLVCGSGDNLKDREKIRLKDKQR